MVLIIYNANVLGISKSFFSNPLYNNILIFENKALKDLSDIKAPKSAEIETISPVLSASVIFFLGSKRP